MEILNTIISFPKQSNLSSFMAKIVRPLCCRGEVEFEKYFHEGNITVEGEKDTLPVIFLRDRPFKKSKSRAYIVLTY
jgi:hypothetical protein